MDYRASSVTLSQKLSNGVSIYDGVFSSDPSKFVVPTFSSRVEDYTEIFGGRSAIPVLEVPEQNEQKASVDVRSSKLDYSKVFSGFGDSDFAVPYEELFEEPKKRDRTQAKKRSPPVEADPPCSEETHVLSREAYYQSFDGAKKFSMSYHKSNHRSKSFTGGTTLHAVPAYTCMIDEITPLCVTESDKPVSSVANDACPDVNIEKGGDYMKATRDASKQASGGGVKVQSKSNQKRSNSIDELFNSHGIHPSNILPFSSTPSEGKGEFKKPMASMFGVSKSDISEGAGSVHSPPYFDEEVDTNSVAAASAAALKKAIEEAQAKITMAKESMERKKVGLQNRAKMSFDNGMKLELRKGGKFSDKATISKEKKTREFHEEVEVPVIVSARPVHVTAAFEDADKVTGAKEAEGETHQNESKPIQTDHRQEEADVSEAAEQFYEFADTGEADLLEAVEQFYEFSDTGEPDVPEAAEQFYEFADLNEQQGAALEHKEANSAEKMIQFVDEDKQEKEKTTKEVFEIPELGGERLKEAEEEDREIEKIFNAVGGTFARCEEHASNLTSAQEVFDLEQNEKTLGAPREHEEIGKLKIAYAKENVEEKPGELEKEKRDNKGLETQELQETKHVKRKLVALEWVEDEKIGMEACKQEEHEIEQKDVHREEDTERTINKDIRQEIIEDTLNDFNDKEDIEKSHKYESESEVNEKLQDTRANEKILKGAACQKKECDKKQKESFEWVESGIMHVLIDRGTEDEKVKVTQGDLKNLDCNFEAEVNLYEQGESEDLNKIQGSTRHMEYDKDVEETPKVPAPEDDGGIIEVSETLIELKENGNQSGSVEEEKGVEEKEIRETDDLALGVKDAEILKQTEDATEIHSSDNNGINLNRNGISFGQKQDDQLAREPEVVCNLGKHVEELGDINKDMMEAEVTVNKEENKNSSRSSHRKRWFGISMAEVSETLIKLKESGNQSEPVEEENDMEEKEICETDGLAPGVRLAEILKQLEAGIETHSSDQNGINENSNGMNYGQKQDDQLAREPEVACNVGKQVDELGEISKDIMEAEGAVNQEENKNNSKSSNRKRWFDNGNKTKAAQLPHMLRSVLLDNEMETSQFTKENKEFLTSQSTEKIEENQRAILTTEESATIDNLLKDVKEGKRENQSPLTKEESKTNYTLQKEVEQEKKENKQEECETSVSSQKEVELEKEHLIQKDIAKGRERERQKERKAVERVIREARERAFVEARERAAGTRHRVMAEAQERLGKTSVQANDNSLAEKASKEAKLKVERAAVERATAEARERALEKALSEKVAYEAGKQAKRSVSEKVSGASTDGRQAKRSVSEKFSSASGDNGIKPSVLSVDTESKGSFPSSTSNQGGTNGESAQRSKARLERNQRTAERAAKALAEKNMRDLLVQKEQAERNRLAEALDAEVKRWSSGKERNLRALLSTLQYILGPDSGWQPIPLTDVITAVAVKKAYRKAALFVHPDKLQQRGASIQQKYTCEKVFDLLKEAWNRFNVEER